MFSRTVHGNDNYFSEFFRTNSCRMIAKRIFRDFLHVFQSFFLKFCRANRDFQKSFPKELSSFTVCPVVPVVRIGGWLRRKEWVGGIS